MEVVGMVEEVEQGLLVEPDAVVNLCGISVNNPPKIELQ
jgi:hypothetical protein